jgi:hypothetical protein
VKAREFLGNLKLRWVSSSGDVWWIRLPHHPEEPCQNSRKPPRPAVNSSNCHLGPLFARQIFPILNGKEAEAKKLGKRTRRKMDAKTTTKRVEQQLDKQAEERVKNLNRRAPLGSLLFACLCCFRSYLVNRIFGVLLWARHPLTPSSSCSSPSQANVVYLNLEFLFRSALGFYGKISVYAKNGSFACFPKTPLGRVGWEGGGWPACLAPLMDFFGTNWTDDDEEETEDRAVWARPTMQSSGIGRI